MLKDIKMLDDVAEMNLVVMNSINSCMMKP